MKKLIIADIVASAILLTAGTAHAELKPMDDTELATVEAQGIQIDLEGSYSYEGVKINDTLYAGQTINLDNLEPVIIDGQTHSVTNMVPLIGSFLPTRAGTVDTTGDGIGDRGAAVLSFVPPVAPGTSGMALSLTQKDVVVNVDNQLFFTNQGIVILNEALTSDLPTGSGIPIVHQENLF